MLFPVFAWRNTCSFLKRCIKVTAVAKSKGIADFLNALGSAGQKKFCLFYFLIRNKFFDADTDFFFELV